MIKRHTVPKMDILPFGFPSLYPGKRFFPFLPYQAPAQFRPEFQPLSPAANPGNIHPANRPVLIRQNSFRQQFQPEARKIKHSLISRPAYSGQRYRFRPCGEADNSFQDSFPVFQEEPFSLFFHGKENAFRVRYPETEHPCRAAAFFPVSFIPSFHSLSPLT